MTKFVWLIELPPLADLELGNIKWLDCSKESKWIYLNPTYGYSVELTKDIQEALQLGRKGDASVFRGYIQERRQVIDKERLVLSRVCFKGGRFAYRVCEEKE